jgi:DNA end-binding protein Ku
MRDKGKVGIGRFVFRTKQHLVAVRPMERVLVLETMFFHDEIRKVEDLEDVPRQRKLPGRELSIAEQLIEAQTVARDPRRYEDTYRERVLKLIRDKAKGEEITVREEAEPEGVADLMEALRASVEAARGGKRPVELRRRAGPTRKTGAGRREESFEERTREELYEQAGKAGIAGRSKMSKQELARALRKAS